MDDQDEQDPIKASYDVFVRPHMQDGRKIYILQFPNRATDQPYTEANGAHPSELRIKPKSGLLEVDVPIDAWRNYDREKGVKWGESLRKSNAVKGGGSHGLPGGFGIGGYQGPTIRRGGKAEDESVADPSRILMDYQNAITTERVLTKQTLGGQAVHKQSAAPQYMIGAFRKSNLVQKHNDLLLTNEPRRSVTSNSS